MENTKKTPKKTKKITKQKKISIFKRKILSTWSLAVRERDKHKCIYCNAEHKSLNKNGKTIILNAHHLLSKDIKNSPLKYDIRNGVTLCPEHQKLYDDGYIAMLVVSNEETEGTKLSVHNAKPTGTLIHIKKNVAEEFFDIKISVPMIYISRELENTFRGWQEEMWKCNDSN